MGESPNRRRRSTAASAISVRAFTVHGRSFLQGEGTEVGYCDGFVAATIVCSVWTTLIARMVDSDCDVSPVVTAGPPWGGNEPPYKRTA